VNAMDVYGKPMLNTTAKRCRGSVSAPVILCIVFAVLALFTNRNAASQVTQPPLADQLVGGSLTYVVQKGDSLTSIGARFGVGVSALAESNRISVNSILREGRRLLIDNRHIVPDVLSDGFVINIPQKMLFFFKQDQPNRAFPVALGRWDWRTPTGVFTVVIKEENPVWNVPKSIQEEMRREGKVVEERVPPCPENPLGKHWLGLSIRGIGIHGTIAPASIYQFQTHGCIRLNGDDIAEIFPQVREGTPGRIIYQRLLVARVGERLFLEVHRDIYRKQPDPLAILSAIAKTHNLEFLLDWSIAKAIIAKQDGAVHEVTKEGNP
jgi:L,D-transpeptidase ErfK/SrfK